MPDDDLETTEHPLVQQAREVAEGITGSEVDLTADKEKLRADMWEFKEALLKANVHLPGLVTWTNSRVDYGFVTSRQDVERRQQRSEQKYQVVLLNEPVENDDGSMTYVIATPVGFRGLRFSEEDKEKHESLQKLIEGSMGGGLYGDYIGYSEFRDMYDQARTIRQLSFGFFGTYGADVKFQNDDLLAVSETQLQQAYENSQRKAAEKLKKVEDPQSQREAIQKERDMGNQLIASLRRDIPQTTEQFDN